MTRILPAGKLTNELLSQLLTDGYTDDPSVLVGPGIGEDTAVVESGPSDLLVLKTDPITFAGERIGYYAVHINANDILTAGATPRWFLTSILLPVNTPEIQIRTIFSEIEETAKSLGITVCGGHTEITGAVCRPVINGTMVGTVSRNRLKQKKEMVPGQTVVLTKTAGYEGTAVLALEFREFFLSKNVEPLVLDEASRFLDGISIYPEASIAADCPGVAAMHDVTEGGVATALRELAAASGLGLDVEIPRIPVDPVTGRLSEICGIDPLGLLGSGALLIAVDDGSVQELTHRLESAKITAVEIAKVTGSGLPTDGALPEFETDEITKMYVS